MRKKRTIQELQRYAANKGGVCLSNQYDSGKLKLEWQCSQKHRWHATWNNIQRGHWCPECAGNKRYTIADLQSLVAHKGGFCISKEYVNSKQRLLWKCSEGHTFSMRANNVQQGQWCPFCAGLNKKHLQQLHSAAEENGGKCLSSNYTNNRTKMSWLCSENHIFEMNWLSVSQGHWCPICAGNTKLTMSDMGRLAKNKNGKCLSTVYSGNKTELIWECSIGHKFKLRPNSVQQGVWCRECANKLRERLVRVCFEQIFETPFPPKRPEWLLNSKNNRMELDGYSEILALAFEHQGIQHYSYQPHFHRKQNTLQRRKSDDSTKRRLCKKAGVILIEVPYTVEIENLQSFIIESCISSKVVLPKGIMSKAIDYTKAYSLDDLKRVQKLAKEKGGKCLSINYINSSTKLEILCTNNHMFSLAPVNLQRGQWCSRCAGNSKKTTKDMREFALEKGGRFLSKEYFGNKKLLDWKCSEGHFFQKKWNKVQQGQWCGECRKKEIIELKRKSAIKRSGSVAQIKKVNIGVE